VFRSIPKFEGPSETELNKGSLTSIAVMIRKAAKSLLLILCSVLTVSKKNARKNETNNETIVTILNKFIFSTQYAFLFMFY
jgi:hypothetical protein